MRHQDFHHSRRREFDAVPSTDHPTHSVSAPGSANPASGPPVSGVVKWFSPEKGFGFIELSDGSGDAFLHSSVLAQSGTDTVEAGETLEVRLAPGHKGPHITEVLRVASSIAVPVAPRRRSATSEGPASGTAVEVTGTVKWFNVQRGFGFITRDDHGQDIFVHVSALERSGIDALVEGQPVVVGVIEGRKGLEAARVRPT